MTQWISFAPLFLLPSVMAIQCQNGGSPTDRLGISCSCPPDFIGLRCEIRLSELLRNPCHPNGYLFSDNDSNGTCVCLPGFTGTFCQTPICPGGVEVNGECIKYNSQPSSKPIVLPNCLHGQWNAAFNRCLCDGHWSGENCANPSCLNGGVAMQSNWSIHCNCSKWFTGAHCQEPKCKHGTVTENKCECREGWKGELCDQRVCTFGGPIGYCTCYFGFSGKYTVGGCLANIGSAMNDWQPPHLRNANSAAFTTLRSWENDPVEVNLNSDSSQKPQPRIWPVIFVSTLSPSCCLVALVIWCIKRKCRRESRRPTAEIELGSLPTSSTAASQRDRQFVVNIVVPSQDGPPSASPPAYKDVVDDPPSYDWAIQQAFSRP